MRKCHIIIAHKIETKSFYFLSLYSISMLLGLLVLKLCFTRDQTTRLDLEYFAIAYVHLEMQFQDLCFIEDQDCKWSEP